MANNIGGNNNVFIGTDLVENGPGSEWMKSTSVICTDEQDEMQPFRQSSKLEKSIGLLEARLELIIGPMWSGKSSELLRRIRKYEVANKKCLIVKPNKKCVFW